MVRWKQGGRQRRQHAGSPCNRFSCRSQDDFEDSTPREALSMVRFVKISRRTLSRAASAVILAVGVAAIGANRSAAEPPQRMAEPFGCRSSCEWGGPGGDPAEDADRTGALSPFRVGALDRPRGSRHRPIPRSGRHPRWSLSDVSDCRARDSRSVVPATDGLDSGGRRAESACVVCESRCRRGRRGFGSIR